MARSRSILGLVLLGAVALSSVACNRVRVEDVRGPDGGEWTRISCKHMDKRCFRVAASMCPSGYYFADSAGPAPAHARSVDADDEESVRAAAPAPRAGVNTKTLPPQERWSSRMYSKKSGAILVQCATATATASN
ncbi:hypothetical protein BH11MYX4_BH11MYX4_65950 [soil metagenome]